MYASKKERPLKKYGVMFITKKLKNVKIGSTFFSTTDNRCDYVLLHKEKHRWDEQKCYKVGNLNSGHIENWGNLHVQEFNTVPEFLVPKLVQFLSHTI